MIRAIYSLIFFLAFSLAALALESAPPAIRSMEITYNDKVSDYIVGVFTVPENFCNTGLAYDSRNHWLVCANLHKKTIEFLDKTGKRVAEPFAAPATQGLAYDSSDDTFWLWGRKDKIRWIYHFTRKGEMLDDGFEFDGESGMLSYDPKLDSLWAKTNNGQYIYRLSCKDGRIVETLNTGMMGGEGVALDPFDRTFWVLLQKELYHLRMDGLEVEILGTYRNPSHNYPPDMKLRTIRGNDISFSRSPDGKRGIIHKPSGGLERTRTTILQVIGSQKNDGRHVVVDYAGTNLTVETQFLPEPAGRDITIVRETYGGDEGLIVDPTDHTLWCNSDQHTHGRTPGGNRCWHVDPLGTYHRKLFLPEAMPWQDGALTGLQIQDSALVLAEKKDSGIFLSPVIDFAAYADKEKQIGWAGRGDITIDYRSSDKPPTTKAAEMLHLPYYPATQANAGWGKTKPSEWDSNPNSGRFVQFRLTLKR